MPTPLIECVPNFSEARRPEVIDAIQVAIQSVPAVSVLDRHSDLDHNRTVITFVGSPAGVEEAAFRAIARAAELINLEQHSGEHPRIGATDVVPFVPISGVSMVECVEIATRLGKRVCDLIKYPGVFI
jgi:glutamate formiminotransferase